MANAPSDPTNRPTDNARRNDMTGISSIGSARTRKLGGETVEFKAVDYQAPESPSARPYAVSEADVEQLDRAVGVSSLRKGPSSPQDGRGGSPLGRKGWAGVAAALVVLAVLVFAGGYALMQGVLTSVNEGGKSELSAGYATDAYTLMAVRGDDGALSSLYLGYVDSIRDRSEFCAIAPSVRYTEDGTEGIETFADVFDTRGLDGLASAVASTASVGITTAFCVTEPQAAELFSLSEGEGADIDPARLAASIMKEPQGISEAALKGLLLALKQVGPAGFVMLQAPVEEIPSMDGGTVLAFRPQEWHMLVHGMRDVTSNAGV